MPEVKLTYFNFKGLGQGIRLMLAYGGQEFEDIRIAEQDWPAYKATTPFGQVPVLEIDGKVYTQSSAICRYLGRKYGLCGKDIEEDFEIDQIIDFFSDIRIKAVSVLFEPDEKVKARKHEDLCKNYYPVVLKKVDEIIAKNNGHMALGKLTWADFLVGASYDSLKRITQNPNLDEEYPNIKRVEQSLLAIPKIKAYIDSAPEIKG